MDTNGSTLFRLTWKVWVTPSGRAFFLLRASERPTSGIVFSSWPSPTCNDAKNSAYAYSQGDHDKPVLKLTGVARLALTSSGERLGGSLSGMESTGRLNPNMVRWLMGLPREWEEYAPE